MPCPLVQGLIHISARTLNKTTMAQMIQCENLTEKIYILRSHKVMLSHDLAKLYGVPTKVLIQAVKRNMDRFPEDFMFQLSWQEANESRSQFVTLKRGQNIKYRTFAFTEQGVAMLSSVLRSERAIQVNIAIMRAFVKLRGILSKHKELANKLEELGNKIEKHDEEIRAIFEAIHRLMDPPQKLKRKIGFHT